MGIYRTLLEEEVPHITDNNDTDEQMKELIDVVEDQDANEAEQDRAQEAEFAEPGTSADELLGESWMAIYEFESGSNEIMQAIGVHELHEAASGREFLMEAPDIKGFFKSVKDKIVAFFKKVWQVLQRWAGNLRAVFTTNKKFGEKYGSAMATGLERLKKDKKELKGYSFDGLGNSVAAKVTSGGKSAVSKISDSLNLDAIKNSNRDAEFYESLLNNFRGGLCGQPGGVTSGEYSKKLHDHLFGGPEPTKMWMDPKTIGDILADKKDDMKAVNEFMKESKTQMKKCIEELNKAEREASKAGSNESDEEKKSRVSAQTQYTRAVAAMRQILTATQIWRSHMLQAIRARAVQARRYGMAYVAAAGREKYKGFQKESTEYGFLGSLGLV